MVTTVMPRIIAETAELLVMDKPSGLIAHSDGRTDEPSLAEWLIEKYPYLKSVGDPWVSPQGQSIPVAGMVHRLDRTTSGVMLVAKNADLFSYLKNEFKARRVIKKYRALVYGAMPSISGRVVAEIMRSSTPPKHWYAHACEETNIRAAITDWEVLSQGVEEGNDFSVLELSPKTGRTHQIRVHMACIGHPIVSDHLYARDMPQLFGFTRPALHAYSISLLMPHGERCTYIAPLHQNFPQI